jgi:3-oxoacyl-[acyl-carrier-protein] synthase II
MSCPRSVVITGMGPISAIGIGREDFWAGVSDDRNGCRAPQRLQGDWPALPQLAECLDFVVEDYLETEKTYLDRCSAFVLAACSLALEDAGLQWRELDHARFGLSIGTAFGCLDSMHNVTARVQGKGLRFASPMIFTHSFANSPASLAAIEYRIEGPVSTVCCGDTSGGDALRYAFDVVRHGRAQVMLAGGVDVLSEAILAALNAAGGCAEGVPAEGGCLFVLETEDSALARKARPLARLCGVGLAGGAGGEDDAAQMAALADARLPWAPTLWRASGSWGHTFAGALPLELAAAVGALSAEAAAFLTLSTDPSGRAAAVVVQRYP